MVYNPTYSTSILESLGVLSGFSFAEPIWDKYEKFAVLKIKGSTLQLRGSLFYLSSFTPNQAEYELKSLRSLMPVLSELRAIIEKIDDGQFNDFKLAAIDFFETIDLLYANLQELCDMHSAYEISKPILAVDWDCYEDEHWNNY